MLSGPVTRMLSLTRPIICRRHIACSRIGAFGIEYIALGGGLIREDMGSQLIAHLKEYNNPYLPVLNERNLD
jgi:hypothetical protein